MNGYLLACIAVLLFSTSPALTRFAPMIGPVEIAFWRLSTGTIAVATFALAARHRIAWRRLFALEFVGYGALVAVHFGSFVASLVFTSTAHSLAITYTAPVFVALASWAVLGEPISRRAIAGILALDLHRGLGDHGNLGVVDLDANALKGGLYRAEVALRKGRRAAARQPGEEEERGDEKTSSDHGRAFVACVRTQP